MALAGPLAGARLIALDTSAFIYLIERPDAIHLATAQLAGADAFVTNDGKLHDFSGVSVVSLRALLGP
jgi:hypothetical protein